MAPMCIWAIPLAYLASYMMPYEPLADRLVIGLFASAPALAMACRLQTLRNLALVPWWAHIATLYATCSAGYALATAEAMLRMYSTGGPYFQDGVIYSYDPLTVLRFYGLVLIAPAFEQWLIAKRLGVEEDVLVTKRGLYVAGVWAILYALISPALISVDQDWAVWGFTAWLALGSLASAVLICNGLALMHRAGLIPAGASSA